MKLIATLALALALTAPDGAVLRGTVRAEGSLELVPYAVVEVAALDRTTVADAHGYYVLADLPAGRWTVEASAMGYEPVTIVVAASGSGSVTMDFELPLRPVTLRGVSTRADRRATAPVLQQPASTVGAPSVRLAGPALQVIPGLAEPDILRSLQILPSVAATSDYSSAPYVRGGSSDQTLLTLDGLPLFNPYHLGGIFSALPTEAVSSVEVWPGAAPARAGDRLSGAVEVRTRNGSRDRIRSNGSIGLLSTSVGLEGPLPGGAGSFILSGRSTYLDAISRVAAAMGLMHQPIPYGLSDVYAKLSHDVGEDGTLTVSGYVDSERFRMVAPDVIDNMKKTETDFTWGSKLLGLTYRSPIGSRFLLEAGAAYSGFRGGFAARDIFRRFVNLPNDEPGYFVVDTTEWVQAGVGIEDFMASLDLIRYGDRHTLRFGARVDDYRVRSHLELLDQRHPAYFPAFERSAQPRTVALYAEDEWRALDWLQLRAGLRYLHAGPLGSAWLPRLGARFEVTPGLSLTAGGGLHAQALRSMKDEESIFASFIAYDVLDAQPADVGLARSWDLVAGAEWSGRNASVRLEGFTKHLEGLVLAPEVHAPMLAPPLITDSFRIGDGRARGLEVLATARLGATDVTAAYNLMFAGRNAGEGWYTPRFERRHTLDLNTATSLGEGLVTARLAIASGQPYTPVVGQAQPLLYTPDDRWLVGQSPFAVFGEPNSRRLPGYLRFDVAYRQTYEPTLFGRESTITPYVQVVNVFNSKNALIGLPAQGGLRLRYLPQLPILPTLGVEWRF